MEVRLSGKNGPGAKSFSAWVRTTKDKRKVLTIILGELKLAIYPFDNNQIRQLGQKLIDIAEGR